MNNQIIPIVFSANALYAPYISVVITSIVSNSSKDYYYKFYIFYTELSDNIILRLEGIRGDNYDTECLNVQKLCEDGMYESAYFSVEMYYRIMIPEILKQYDKVLYLDCDIVVLEDISKLYFVDLTDSLLGGIRNLMHEKMKKYIEFSLQIDPDKYINSGVILFNLAKCREVSFTEKAFKILRKHQDFRYPDQDLINMISVGKITYLDPRWNFTWHYRHLQESSNMELHLDNEDLKLFYEYEKKPYLIHYTGETKPWNNPNKYLSDYFWLYAKDSVFFNLFLNRLIRDNITNAQNELYKRMLGEFENKIINIQNNNPSIVQQQVQIVEQSDEFLNKYNEVIGSGSYKLGRLITFPFRKSVDAIRSIRSIGLRDSLKLIPSKLKLYKNIIIGKS